MFYVVIEHNKEGKFVDFARDKRGVRAYDHLSSAKAAATRFSIPNMRLYGVAKMTGFEIVSLDKQLNGKLEDNEEAQ